MTPWGQGQWASLGATTTWSVHQGWVLFPVPVAPVPSRRQVAGLREVPLFVYLPFCGGVRYTVSHATCRTQHSPSWTL